MRLIDADKITDKEISQYLGVEYASCTEDIRSLIDDQSTVLNRESHGVLHKIAKYLTEKYEGDDDNAPTLDITIGDMREICGMHQDLSGARKLLEQGQLYGRWWIPVTERVPEDGGIVLLSCENPGVLPDVGTYKVDEEGGAFYPMIGEDDKSYASVGIFVNAWMPLPEPYREE